MRLVFSPGANADLGGIFDYIAIDSPLRAERFVDDLIQAAADIVEYPFAWPLIPRYEARGFRRRSFRGYVIFFEATDETVMILRILNGARDYERLLFHQDDSA